MTEKDSEETLTVIIFRGARANPWRLKIRKSFLKHGVIFGLCLLLVQGGILAHYAYQWKQLEEFEAVKQELALSKARTNNFSTEVDGIKKRMVVLENLNRKLQTMFGLETDDVQSVAVVPGQGGEEFPYEGSMADHFNSQWGDSEGEEGLNALEVSPAVPSMEKQIEEIKTGLNWLNHQTDVEGKILDELATVAHEKVEQWASTPSIWPIKGRLTSRFGLRVSPFTGKKALHAGIDIGAPTGTEVRAPASGKVVVAAYDGKMGKFIRIDHGYGVETTYGHLSKIHVKYGDRVQRGDLIGLVGSTGKFSTGPHLHYQVAVNDKVVDPLHYILD